MIEAIKRIKKYYEYAAKMRLNWSQLYATSNRESDKREMEFWARQMELTRDVENALDRLERHYNQGK